MPEEKKCSFLWIQQAKFTELLLTRRHAYHWSGDSTHTMPWTSVTTQLTGYYSSS